MNGQTQQYNASLAAQIRQLNQETDRLVILYRQKQVQKAILQAKYQETEQKFTEASKQLGGVLNVEIHRSWKPTSLCFKISKTPELGHHLHFQNTTRKRCRITPSSYERAPV